MQRTASLQMPKLAASRSPTLLKHMVADYNYVIYLSTHYCNTKLLYTHNPSESPSMMVATVIPSVFFLPLKSVRLGRFIKNIGHPHEGYYEPPNFDVPEAIVSKFSFSSSNQQNRKTRFESALTSLMSAGFSKRLQSEVHLAPASGSNYSLDNSDAWFDKAVSLPDTRRWIENAALRGHKIYIIVGIQTFTDTRIVQKSAREQRTGGQANVPVSLFLTAATGVMPIAELVDPAIHGEHQNAESDQLWLLAPGEQVCSLQYREVKTRWLSSRLIEPLQLSKTRQWSCMEGDKRDTYEDDSDEGDEDTIEVDLGDVEEFNGEWDAGDSAEGTIYYQSSPDQCDLPS